MSRLLLVAALAVLAAGCEDTALVETIERLDAEIAAARVRSKALMDRQQDLAQAAPVGGALATGSDEDVGRYLGGLGVGDHVGVQPKLGHLEIRLTGERGRRQAAQSLLRLGVEAPLLELDRFESKGDAWTMVLRLPRPAVEAASTSSIATIEVPEPSFFSFSEGKALHARAEKKRVELETLQRVLATLEAREARQRRIAAVAQDATALAEARVRRHFATALLPSVGDGTLSFSEGRATWTGDTGFETIEDAQAAFDDRAKVIGYAPGPRGSLTADLTAPSEP